MEERVRVLLVSAVERATTATKLSMRQLLRVWLLSLLAWGTFGLPTALRAADEKSPQQSQPEAEASRITIRKPEIHIPPLQVDVDMVVVNVTVTDPYDRIITGLDQNNFQVFDDKVEQRTGYYAPTQ
jgi:Ca-activated chloride channel family protein